MKFLLLFVLATMLGCATTSSKSLYQQLGGHQKVTDIVDNFIAEIEFDSMMFESFKDSNIDRFREKLVQHVCVLTGGPCEYTGDSMEQVHHGMNISEGYFNHSVDLFIGAMDKAEVPHSVQNKVLAVLVPMRRQIIYR